MTLSIGSEDMLGDNDNILFHHILQVMLRYS